MDQPERNPLIPESGRVSTRLILAAQLRDRRALNDLLVALQRPLARHLEFVLRSDDIADVLQETLWTISRKIGDLRDPRWFRAWAFRIATRTALRYVRRARGKHALVGLDDIGELPAGEPAATAFEMEDLTTLRAALDLAPPASQLVLRMYYLNELSHVEIAEALDISIGTVKSRHHYGLEWLRRHLQASSLRDG